MGRSTSTIGAARWVLTAVLLICLGVGASADAQESGKKGSSYMPVDIKEDFAAIMARMKGAKPEVMKRQMDFLNERYDLSNRRPGRDDGAWQSHPGRRARHTASGYDLGEAGRHEP